MRVDLFLFLFYTWLKCALFGLIWTLRHFIDSIKYFFGIPYKPQLSPYSSRSTSDEVINDVLTKDNSKFAQKLQMELDVNF